MKPQNNLGSDILEKCDPDLGGDLRESPELKPPPNGQPDKCPTSNP